MEPSKAVFDGTSYALVGTVSMETLRGGQRRTIARNITNQQALDEYTTLALNWGMTELRIHREAF